MSTITAVLEPSPDGTLHLPVPEAWRKLPIRVKAELEPAEAGAVEGYSLEWRDAFGSIEDPTFKAPARTPSRAAKSLDGA